LLYEIRTHLLVNHDYPNSSRFGKRVLLCLSHAPNLEFSMEQTANEQNSQNDDKGDLKLIDA